MLSLTEDFNDIEFSNFAKNWMKTWYRAMLQHIKKYKQMK